MIYSADAHTALRLGGLFATVPAMAALDLSSQKRKKLRALAHELKPVVLVGQDGITDGLVREVDRALLDHELIKVQMRRPAEKDEMATALAAATESVLCGLVGHVVILYRPHPDKPKISV